MFRITGEPLFVNSADGLMYSEQFGYGNSNESSPSAVQTGAVGFDFRSHATDLEGVLSAAVGGHQQVLHGAAGLNPDESDDDDMSEDYDDIDDDEESNRDESSQGELDE